MNTSLLKKISKSLPEDIDIDVIYLHKTEKYNYFKKPGTYINEFFTKCPEHMLLVQSIYVDNKGLDSSRDKLTLVINDEPDLTKEIFVDENGVGCIYFHKILTIDGIVNNDVKYRRLTKLSNNGTYSIYDETPEEFEQRLNAIATLSN